MLEAILFFQLDSSYLEYMDNSMAEHCLINLSEVAIIDEYSNNCEFLGYIHYSIHSYLLPVFKYQCCAAFAHYSKFLYKYKHLD
mgnify:CR=1 FL=1